MKLKNIIICGVSAAALSSCCGYLDVDAPSSFTDEIVYGSTTQANYALNGVYADMLSSNSFGNLLYNGMMLNSDVDFTTNSSTTLNEKSPRRFDVNSQDGNVEKLWNALYANIESANSFINGMEASGLLEGEESEKAYQMVGEAKVIRAINYYELMCYFGDVPFTTQSSYASQEFAPDVKNRTEIADFLINDLKEAAEKMYSDQTPNIESVEHISQEAAYAMIARIALQAGGYSLNHDADDVKSYKMTRPANYKGYYNIAMDYCSRVMASGHKLDKNYRDVFVDECNFKVAANDDAIFEIPFAKETSGSFGYAQGPKVEKNTENEAPFEYGIANGDVRTTAFYRYQFGENDNRKEYLCGMWNYAATGVPTINFGYTMNNNKWSKLWCQSGLGKKTEGNTGINFPYIRYADVLLMYAEAANEINEGPTAEAKGALRQVRERAFRGADNFSLMVDDYIDALNTKEDFLKAVLNERKWEFAGENMRWKDLVRNNMYGEVVTYTFLLYLSAAEDAASSAQYYDEVMAHDGIDYQNILPSTVYSCGVDKHTKNPNFPNGSVYQRFVLNEDHPASKPGDSDTPDKYELKDKYGKYTFKTEKQMGGQSEDKKWTETEFTASFQKDGTIRPEIYYSLSGYIYGLETGNIYVKNNNYNDVPFNIGNTDYPAVRYMLPYPAEIIARSSGKYRQYYGY